MIKKILTLALTVVLISISALFLTFFSKRQSIVNNVPIGSSIENVMKYCTKKGLTCRKWEESGYINHKTGKQVGVKFVDSLVSEKKVLFLFTITDEVFFGFDKENKLIEIYFWTVVDSL